MKGLELARMYFEACRPALQELVPDVMACAAVGLVGEGSECFGLDDAASRDHDFGAGFCLWLPDELLAQKRNLIAEAFAALPAEFQGFQSRLNAGDGRVGALGISEFYRFFTGLERPPADWREWLAIPEDRLACAVNGEVFLDATGAFTAWREQLLAFYPEDVRLKKIAARVMLMAQAGQYNLPRCLGRGDHAAAMLAAARFAETALSFVFLLNRRYAPYYKLAPRLAGTLPVLGNKLRELLEHLGSRPLADSVAPIEQFCALCANELNAQGLSTERDPWLWVHGPAIAMRISNPEIQERNLLSD